MSTVVAMQATVLRTVPHAPLQTARHATVTRHVHATAWVVACQTRYFPGLLARARHLLLAKAALLGGACSIALLVTSSALLLHVTSLRPHRRPQLHRNHCHPRHR